MSEWVDLPLPTQMGEEISSYISDAELTNLMLVPNPPGSPRPFHILNTPAAGDALFTSVNVPGGMLAHGDYLWRIVGGQITAYDPLAGSGSGPYNIVNTGLWQLIGTAANEVVVVGGSRTTPRAYRVTTAGASLISPPAGLYRGVAYLDGYTIYIRQGTDEFYLSDLDDPTTIDALSFSTADAVADQLVACITNHRELILFGKRHTEFWYNSGAAGFPLARSSPGMIERGIADVGACCKWDNAVFFLGDDLRVYRLEGYRPTPISTPWVERYIHQAEDYDDMSVRMFAFAMRGRAYLGLSFVFEMSQTLFYDIDAGLWHIRDHNAGTNIYYVDVCRVHKTGIWHKTFAMLMTGVTGATNICEIEPDSLTTDSYRDNFAVADTTRRLTLPAFEIPGQRVNEYEVELLMEKVDGGSPGTVTLKYSDDGGTTYITHSAQSTNQDRIRWNRLGQFRRRIHRFEFTTNARVAIHGARARIEAVAA